MPRQKSSKRMNIVSRVGVLVALAGIGIGAAGLSAVAGDGPAAPKDKAGVIDILDPTWLGRVYTEAELRKQLAELPEVLLEDIRPAAEKKVEPGKAKGAEPEKDVEEPAATGGAKLLELVKRIKEKNKKSRDGFIRELRDTRDDLAGLPFLLGADYELSRAQAEQLHLYARAIREAATATEKAIRDPERAPARAGREPDPRAFWSAWSEPTLPSLKTLLAEAATKQKSSAAAMEARALEQLFAAEHPGFRWGMIHRLDRVREKWATEILVRQALFAPDRDVRQAAISALWARPKQEYTPLLMEGFRYPWAPAAHHAAHALVQLRRTDLLPELVRLLEASDPAEPVETNVAGKTVFQVREVVRINHHRNCLLCHAPGDMKQDAATGLVLTPGKAFMPPLSVEYYHRDDPTAIRVRADVTYLRQDFSAKLPVKDHKEFSWPEEQRFDFVVRTRTISKATAAKLRQQLKDKSSDHRQAITFALRRLSGSLEADDSPPAWRARLRLEPNWRSPCLK